MMLYWFVWLLCLSANAEITASYRQPKYVTLECSTLGCLDSIDTFAGMYLYKDGEEVLYYNNDPKLDQLVPQEERYVGRLQKKGCLQDNIITISNVTVADSGVYKCVYVKYPRQNFPCNVHKIEISEEAPQPSAELPGTFAQESTQNTTCPSLSYVIIITSTVSVLLTMISTLLIILMVKQFAGGRILTTRTDQGVADEYVYEVMTKDGFRSATGNLPNSYT